MFKIAVIVLDYCSPWFIETPILTQAIGPYAQVCGTFIPSVELVGASNLGISPQFESFKEWIRIKLVEPYWFLLEPENKKRCRGYLKSPQCNVSALATTHIWTEWKMVTALFQIATLHSPGTVKVSQAKRNSNGTKGACSSRERIGQLRKSLRQIRVPQIELIWAKQGKAVKQQSSPWNTEQP